MNTKTTNIIALAFVIAMGVSNAFAQVVKTDTLPTVVIRGNSVVSQKVSDAFKGSFSNAMDARWYQIDKKYLVKFMTEDQQNTALYKKTGYLVYHITYGKADNLPYEAVNLVYKEYKNCRITTAIHVNQDQRSIWVVNLEYGKSLIMARIEDNQLQEIQKVRNGTVQ